MPALNGGTGNIIILKQPKLASTIAGNMGYSQSASKVLASCNAPMIYQIQWGQTLTRVTNLMIDDAYLAGDLVNVIAKASGSSAEYAGSTSGSIYNVDMEIFVAAV